MKTECGKYIIYNNDNTSITVLNKETDHFITAVLKTGIIQFYSDTIMGDFSESIKINATSKIVFDNDFLVKTNLENCEITYSFANHSTEYDALMKEFNGIPNTDAKARKICNTSYDCKMQPQRILFSKNNDIYAYGTLNLMIKTEHGIQYLTASLEKFSCHTKITQIFENKIQLPQHLVNYLRPVFAFPLVSIITEGDNDNIVEIRVVKNCEFGSSNLTNTAYGVTDKADSMRITIKLGDIPVAIYYGG